jgi:hypothetical protein
MTDEGLRRLLTLESNSQIDYYNRKPPKPKKTKNKEEYLGVKRGW